AEGVTVVGEWVEISFRKRGLSRRVPHLVALTGDNGWFAMCHIPTAGTLSLIASRGPDSTDLIEVGMPPGGFLRHELFLGPATNVITQGNTDSSDSLASQSRRVHAGTGKLSGVVVAANGTPVAGAQVSITDGPQTSANERGEWALVDAPAGTRMLEVRALGFYPNRRRVDVISAAAPVRVTLSTLRAVLDEVMITASRLNRDPSGFKDRSRTGLGRYLKPEDIVRLQPVTVSDLFRSIPGVQVEYDSRALDKRIFMRSSRGPCQPAIYINGLPMTGQVADSVLSGVGVVTLIADDLDTWMRPNDVTGIEIYPGETAPIEYQQSMSGCGSILIWTKLKR
ncbi:MAG TPA: carboxypeptidase regulatory-like domain-containing protein, partial [Gemmatimonadaceae bacterium]|nr:carboxypeptidase regulatory-like domain-containing protein [Gemmatimonadaceae bacterium]